MDKPLFSIVAIAKNEAKVLPRLLGSLQEFKKRGGQINIVDTGSTDNTVKIAKEWDCNVKEVGPKFVHTITQEQAQVINERFVVENEIPVVNPGETFFDFASARNEVVSISEKDWVCTVDCDEILTKLDIDKLNLIISNPNIAHLEYNFVFSHMSDGSELIKFTQSKFYDRRKMEWTGIIHEVLTPKVKGTQSQFVGEDIFKLEHWQNPESNRTGYLRGLAVDCFNHQEKDRNSHYFAREMWWHGRPWSAAKEFKRHIEMKAWPAERAESMLFLCDIYGAMEKPDEQLYWAHRAIDTEPTRREGLIKLAQIYSRRKEWIPANFYATAALELPWHGFYGSNRAFYTNEPHEILYVAKGWMGDIAGAQKHLLKCLEYQPNHPAYIRDTQFYFDYKDHGIEGWMEFPALTFLYKTSKRMESVCEVGSWKGRSTHAIASGCRGPVTAIDHWKGSSDPKDLTNPMAKQEDVFAIFTKNTIGLHNIVTNRKSSLDAVKDYPDRSFDMVFIDAGHTCEEVREDIRAWMPKAKLLICGHDYLPGVWDGVIRAVNEEIGMIDGLAGTLWYKWIKKPRVSICIPTLGRPEKLKRLLDGIKENANYDNYEVIVKTDKMPPNNEGVPKMLAKCVAESTGELVMFLGNDCIPEPNFLQEAVWDMIRHFPEFDGMIGLNDGYWDGSKGHVSPHWLASKKLLPYLGGNFFDTDFYHTGVDNLLQGRCEKINKYFWSKNAKIIHDHPMMAGKKEDMDDLYKQAYSGPRHDHDNKLYLQKVKEYGLEDRKWV